MSGFKPGDRVKVWMPDAPQFHGYVGTVEADEEFPATNDGYDVWVRLDDEAGRRWPIGPYGFFFDELRAIESGGQS